jgi:hypothetical protein
MRSPADALEDPRPGDQYQGFDEATVGHFRVCVDVVGARNVYFDVIRRFGATTRRIEPIDQFVHWVGGMEVLYVAQP